MFRAYIAPLRVFFQAALERVLAARRKFAICRFVVKVGRLPVNRGQTLGARFVHFGQSFEQGARIRVLRVGKKLFHFCVFHDLPRIHHRHTVGDFGDDAEVMGDPDNRHAKLLAQLFD